MPETPPPEPASIVKMCSVYLQRNGNRAIVAAMGRDVGCYYELEDCISNVRVRTEGELGQIVRDRFKESHKGTRPRGSANGSTWPALRVSGMGTYQRFYRNYIHIGVEGANMANAMVKLQTDPVQTGLRLTAMCNPNATEQLGSEILRLKRHYMRWKKI